ncbi:APC family permease [Goekera deserti]|uniref:APC family permease n=1 Tax=Goekera deserti TaxID=2497753 RepID=UPI001F44C95B|nr:APC family permease [Goekera deserti]
MAGTLARRLGTGDAVVLGLGSMIGAGVFVVWGPAAAAAGWWLLAGLAVAAVVAWCNAQSTAALAVRHPTSGGAYLYGRAQLGPWWGFVAGWSFVVGKTASCAAMALTVGGYLWPGQAREVAAVAVVALAAVNSCGITRTARLTRVLLAVSLALLLVVLVAATTGVADAAPGWDADPGGARGVLTAAGLLFFAFAGYARIATLAEEVRDPARTIPRAVSVALPLAVVLYAVVGVVVLRALGPEALASSSAPLADAVRAGSLPGLAWVAVAAAAVAGLGALLGLLAGIGRTALAMAREGDLPRGLSVVHPRSSVPVRVEVLLALLVGALVLTADVTAVIGASSFGVLLYYAVANAAAWTLPAGQRPPLAVPALGLAGCLLLVVTLPVVSLAGGAAVLLAGVAGRLVVRRLRRQPVR